MRGSGTLRTSAVPGGVLTGPWVRNALWRNARAVPSLDLDFANNKSLTDSVTSQNLVSFTRASSATFVDSSGVLRSAVTNLLLRSEEFDNASWGKTGLLAFGSGSTANAIAAPNGSITADLLTEDTSTGQHRVTQTVSGTINTNTYTLSVYIKAKERTRFYVGIVDSPGFSRQGNAVFNLSNGTVVSANTGLNGATGGVASIQDVGNGWYRCSYSLVLGGTNTAIFCDLNIVSTGSTISYTGDGTSGLYLWGAQLEQASTVGDYVPTTSAINSAPRFDHSITSSTTNLKTGSQDFSNTYWSSSNATRVNNAAIAPDGTTTACLVTGTGTSFGGLVRSFGVSYLPSTTYSFSCFAKAGTHDLIGLRMTGDCVAGQIYCRYNLTTGQATAITPTAGTVVSVSAVPFANGWYRCNLIYTTKSTQPSNDFVDFSLLTSTGDHNYVGTGNLYVWGAQFEQSATVGPYVPTTTAAVTSNTTDSLGLLVEEARTNSVTNNTMVGAVAGTPGTPPTGWIYATTSSNGLAISVVGTGVENGINYIDYRFNGTTVASPSACAIGLVNATAATGQTWTASTYWKLVGGTATGVTGWNIGIIENTSGGAFVTGAFYSQTTPTSAPLITQRFAATRTLSGGATVGMVTYPFNFAVAGNTAIDFTIRIGLPQLEQGAFATSVIPTTSATVTRAADVASITGSNFGVTRTNLLLRSEEFDNASWGKTNSTATANSTTAPNGTATADRVAEDTVNTQHFIAQNVTISSNTAITASTYVKFDSANRRAFLQINDGTNYAGVILAQDGSVAAQDTGFTNRSFSAEAVGSGWYRLRMSLTTATATNITVRVVLISGTNTQAYLGDGTSGIYVWGAQLETGSAATPYIPSTTTFTSRASGASYFDAAGVLQWKPQNLLVQSENLGTTWTLSGATISLNATVAPDGQTTADTLIPNNGVIGVARQDILLTDSTTYTFSVFLKTAGLNSLNLQFYNKANTFHGSKNLDLSTGILSGSETIGVSSVIAYGNGWYRLTVTNLGSGTGATTPNVRIVSATTGNGTSGFYVWGAQLEQNAGSFTVPGEYTPTVATATGGARNSAFLPDSSGVFRSAGPLLLEGAATNGIRNNTMVGAVAGTPGTAPTNWNVGLAGGLTREIVRVGSFQGVNYIDLRVYGTASNANLALNLSLEGNTVAAVFGQTWTVSSWLQLVGGTTNGLSVAQLDITSRDSLLADVSYQTGTNLLSTLNSFVRFSYSPTLNAATTAYAVPSLWIQHAGIGSVVDFTLRIGMPQFELGAFPTSVIPTSTTAVTRAADVSTSTATSVFESSWYSQAEGTIEADFVCGFQGSSVQSTSSYGIWGITNPSLGSFNGYGSRLVGNANTNDVINSISRYAPASQNNQVNIGLLAFLNYGQTYKTVFAWDSSVIAGTSAGATVQTNTNSAFANNSGVTQLLIGNQNVGGSGPYQLNGTIRRLTYWPRRLADTILQQLTR